MARVFGILRVLNIVLSDQVGHTCVQSMLNATAVACIIHPVRRVRVVRGIRDVEQTVAIRKNDHYLAKRSQRKGSLLTIQRMERQTNLLPSRLCKFPCIRNNLSKKSHFSPDTPERTISYGPA